MSNILPEQAAQRSPAYVYEQSTIPAVHSDTNDVGDETEEWYTPCPTPQEGLPPIEDKKSSQSTLTLEETYNAASEKFICAFGPAGSFFFYGGDPSISWKYNSPRSSDSPSIAASTVGQWMINEPHQVALSPHGAGYFAYTSCTDGLIWRFVNVPADSRPKKRKARKQFDKIVEAYSRLREWPCKHVVTSDDIKKTQVAFGPASRYIAGKQNGEYISNDLPASFQDKLNKKWSSPQSSQQLPKRISFGHDEAWMAIWHDSAHDIHTDKKCPFLEQTLAELGNVHVTYIALDCSQKGEQYFLSRSDIKFRARLIPSRRVIWQGNWDSHVLEWSQRLHTNLQASSKDESGTSLRIITPKDALNTEAARLAKEANKSQQLAEDAALLSIESSKKSMRASEVAVSAGVIAIAAAACTVM